MNAVERIEELTEKLIGTGLSYDAGAASLARSLFQACHQGGRFGEEPRHTMYVGDEGNGPVVLPLPDYVSNRLTRWGGMTESEADAYVSAYAHFAREAGERARL